MKWEKQIGWKGDIPWMADNPPFRLVVQPWWSGTEHEKFQGHIYKHPDWHVTIHSFFKDLEEAKRVTEELSFKLRKAL